MTNDFDHRLDTLLREAAKAGNRSALREWRIRHGYTEEPHLDAGLVPVKRSWYFERGADRGYYSPALNGPGFDGTMAGDESDERASNLWGDVTAQEEAFASGMTSWGLAVGESFTDLPPNVSRARRAALAKAVADLAETKARLAAAAAKGGDRQALLGLRRWLSRREAAVRRASSAALPS